MTSSNSRRTSLLLTGLGACCFFAVHSPRPDPVFQRRHLVQRNLLERLFSHHYFSEATARYYRSLNFDRSLLVHKCGGTAHLENSWCRDKNFAFASVLQRAAELTHNDPEKLTADWFADAKPKIGFKTENFAGTPFHVLAVVNRLDLAATADGSSWRKAEIRFVYGLPDSVEAPKLTLIVEFVFAPMAWKEFRGLAEAWQGLSALPVEDGNFKVRLAEVVAAHFAHPVEMVRVRTVSNILTATTLWTFLEWNMRHADGIAPAPLEHQAKEYCTTIAATANECGDYYKLWNDVAAATSSDRPGIPVPKKLRTYSEQGGGESSTSLSTPKGMCGPNLEARDVLALRQCTYCHGGETATDFNHIKNRLASETEAKLSRFLIGNQAKPSIEDLFRGDPDVAFSPVIRYAEYVRKGSDQCDQKTETRYKQRRFHDLARRALFLSEVLALPGESNPPQESVAFITRHAPNFAH